MHPLTALLTLSTLLPTALTQYANLNTSQEYNLRTCLKPNQPGKERFENLWLSTFHIGAAQSDAVFLPDRTNTTPAAFLTPSNTTAVGSDASYSQAFDLGNPVPWQFVMATNVNGYANWEPVRVFAGLGASSQASAYQTGGFFLNETGLQWGALGGFPGWIVCDRWHGLPQLFFHDNSDFGLYGVGTLPCSCADVNLMPEYI
ncbi:hypothetical protein LTR08_007478 [Meristemomyces frigidus]|nr:hypothetical protein LTR08_007478 [Meristemomyces frigidus]